MVDRLLNLADVLGTRHSAFLFGTRGTGKTSLVKSWVQDRNDVLHLDLLRPGEFSRYLKDPGQFEEDVDSALKRHGRLFVFVDEVQKLPLLLDVVHRAIENHKGKVQFILTGSSARKLMRGGANLLAGRAWTLKLHPLTHREGVDDLRRALRFGTLPGIYLESEGEEMTLKAYVDTYLREEILQEGIVRRLDGFVKFLEVAAQMNGEPANYTAVARQAGVSPNTCQDYFSILSDTWITWRLSGWDRSVRKQLLQAPKHYFFDCGVLNTVRGELSLETQTSSSRYGNLFETWIMGELFRLNDYAGADFKFHYWRTNSGMEVDVLVSRGTKDPHLAIEIKSHTAPHEADLKGLIAFKDEYPKAKLVCFCRTPRAYAVGPIDVLPWQEGFAELFIP
jgi:predicted AAA+ superfamily ATPase